MVPNMHSKKRLLPVITFISIFFTFVPTMAGAKTPVIGLALSGGGVKGFAHIGVLKAIGTSNLVVGAAVVLQIILVTTFGVAMGAAISLLLALGLPASVPIVFTGNSVLLAVAALLLIGPVGGLAHSPEEYLEVESFVPRAQAMARAILRIDQAGL